MTDVSHVTTKHRDHTVITECVQSYSLITEPLFGSVAAAQVPLYCAAAHTSTVSTPRRFRARTQPRSVSMAAALVPLDREGSRGPLQRPHFSHHTKVCATSLCKHCTLHAPRCRCCCCCCCCCVACRAAWSLLRLSRCRRMAREPALRLKGRNRVLQ